MADAPRILVVEDDPELAALIPRLLRRAGFEGASVHSLALARDALGAQRWDALVVDRGLADGDGLAFIAELRARDVATPAVLISGAPVAIDDPRTRFLKKPFGRDDLAMLVATMLPRR